MIHLSDFLLDAVLSLIVLGHPLWPWQAGTNPFNTPGVWVGFSVLLCGTYALVNVWIRTWKQIACTTQMISTFMTFRVAQFSRNQWSGNWFNVKIPSYLYRNSPCGGKVILQPSYLHNEISYTCTGKTSLCWIRPWTYLYSADSIYFLKGFSIFCSWGSSLGSAKRKSTHWHQSHQILHSMNPGRCGSNFKSINFKLITVKPLV